MSSGEDSDVEQWTIRHAGRESGPFDAERLRVMARRGALTRFHQVSADGATWLAATQLRNVFNADGSVVSGRGFRGEPPLALRLPEASDNDMGQVPQARVWRSPGSASVLSAQVGALILGTLALAAPTSRGADGALQWWPFEGSLSVSVHALCGMTLLAWWVLAFLPPLASTGAALAAMSAVLAAAAVLPLAPWATWAIPAALVLPLAGMLVAFDSQGSSQTRAMGTTAAVVGGVGALLGAVMLWQHFSPWGAVAVSFLAVGGVAMVVSGARAASSAGSVFHPAIVGAVALGASLFAASVGGLVGDAPIQGATGAVSAALCLSLSVLAWSGTHQALGGIGPRPQAPFEPSEQ